MMWPFRRPQDSPVTDGLWLIVGLGNPGAQYANTRHNVGFMAVEHIARQRGMVFRGSKQRADIARGEIDGTPVILAMPLTFMNESGIAVRHLCQYYKIPLERTLVICDDLDLPFGRLRLRPSGSSGGNNGLKSIIQHLGSEQFARLRIGVGRPRGNAVKHVLGVFPAEEARQLPDLLDVVAREVEAVLRDGVLAAMNEFNRDWIGEERSESG